MQLPAQAVNFALVIIVLLCTSRPISDKKHALLGGLTIQILIKGFKIPLLHTSPTPTPRWVQEKIKSHAFHTSEGLSAGVWVWFPGTASVSTRSPEEEDGVDPAADSSPCILTSL